MLNDLAADPGTRPVGEPGCGSYGLLIASAAWVLVVTVLTQVPTWVIDNLRLDSTDGLPGWSWVLATWLGALLMGFALVPLALLTRDRRLQAVYSTWAVAAGCSALLAPARIFSIVQVQPALAAGAGLSLLAAGLLAVAARARGSWLVPGARGLPVALALGAILGLPSLAWGALGSPLDAALGLANGLSLGLLAGVLLDGWLVRPLLAAGEERWLGRGDRALAVFGAGTALFILVGAAGIRGSQFLLLIALPPLGMAVTALASLPGGFLRPRRESFADGGTARMRPGGWLPAAALIGAAAAAVLAFWDPSELTLVLGPGDILGWALGAAVRSLLLAAIAGLILLTIAGRLARREEVATPALGRGLLWLLPLAAWLVAALVYWRAGHPGFYGEEFFVILRDQPDVSAAARQPDRKARLRYVYTTLTQRAEAGQARLRAALDGRGIAYRPYYLVNGLQVAGGPLLRAYLAGQPEVDRVVNSQRLRPLPAQPAPARGDQGPPAGTGWNIQAIGADRAWRDFGATGRGIVIGQSDSGVQGDHPALRDGYRGRGGQDDYNWLDPWYGTRQPTDSGGHGTHTLGTSLGRGGIGVAPDAEWMACVNLARNLGNPGWYLDCLQFMLAPYPQGRDPFRDGDPARAAHVLNNSWGCPPIEGCDANTLAAATAALRAAGIFVVASAGNGGEVGCGSVADPIALYGDVLTVGAVDRSGELASFSSRGPVTVDGSARVKPDVVAPGVDVLSAFPGGTYATESGTSMAGPHVAGVVALMWSAQPRLIGDVDRTTEILRRTARPYTGPTDACAGPGIPNNDAGYGLVDAYAATKAAVELP